MKNCPRILWGAALVALLSVSGIVQSVQAQSRVFFNSLRTTTGSRKNPVTIPAQIYSMNEDGTDKQQITSGTSDAQSPAASPTGAYVAFIRDGLLQVTETVGEQNGARTLTVAPAAAVGCDWAPQGNRLCYVAPVDANTSGFGLWIVEVDPDTGVVGTPTLVKAPHCLFPSWSNGGGKIAYTDGTAGNNAQLIKVLDLATGVEISFNVVPGNTPSWSRDDNFIAFSALNTVTTVKKGRTTTLSYQEIFVANADGTGIIQVTDFRGGTCAKPTWSPDQTQLIFRSNPSGAPALYRVDLPSGAVNLVGTGADNPDWN